MFIRVYVNHKENTVIIKKREIINVFIVKNVLSKRKAYIYIYIRIEY